MTLAIQRTKLGLVLALLAPACGGGGEASRSPETPRPPPRPVTETRSEASAPLEIDRPSLRAFAATRGFRLGIPRAMTPTPDGKSVLFLRSAPRDPKQSLFETDTATGATKETLSPDTLLSGPETLSPEERARRERMRIMTKGFTSFELSKDGARVLLTLSGRLFVLERASGQTTELATAGSVIDPHFTLAGDRVFYVRDGDVRSIGVTKGSREVSVTRGGTATRPHGVAEFVAQEEFDRSRGFWISPDGSRVFYEEVDNTKVETFSVQDIAHPERDVDKNPYPRAGKVNAVTRFGLISARGGATTWVNFDRARYEYIASVHWDEAGPLVVWALDRPQKHGALLEIDPASGKTRVLVEEKDDAWVNCDPSVPRFIDGGKSFLWSSERSGGWQLELHDTKTGALTRALTPRELGYEKLLHVDAKTRVAYVAASAEPTDMAVHAIPFDGAPHVVAGAAGEMAWASFTEGSNVFAMALASRTGMPRFAARSIDGAVNREIPHVREAPAVTPAIEYVAIGPDHLRVGIVRPKGFVKGRSYPLLDAAYGGPGALTTLSDASQYLRQQWVANATGAIVVTIDARGTPQRGRDWERAIKGKAGTVPIDGHVAAIDALAARYPEIDRSRVGVYGWSYGGYFSGYALLSRPDIYKVGVIGAPVVDWRDYDTAYTERLLGSPDTDGAAYDASSLLTQVGKEGGAGSGRILVVHGTADDNVYFLNSLKLVDALERAGRPFELMPLAGTTHMLIEPIIHEAVWARAAQFLRDGLK